MYIHEYEEEIQWSKNDGSYDNLKRKGMKAKVLIGMVDWYIWAIERVKEGKPIVIRDYKRFTN